MNDSADVRLPGTMRTPCCVCAGVLLSKVRVSGERHVAVRFGDFHDPDMCWHAYVDGAEAFHAVEVLAGNPGWAIIGTREICPPGHQRQPIVYGDVRIVVHPVEDHLEE